MRSGYYIVLKDLLLSAGAHRIKLHRGDWLVTDGATIGRFDKVEELDWLPLEWVKGAHVALSEIETVLEPAVVQVPPARLDAGFRKLVEIEPGEPTPDMPMPSSLNQLRAYLKARRTLVAYTYLR